jgi:hypothetical protein
LKIRQSDETFDTHQECNIANDHTIHGPLDLARSYLELTLSPASIRALACRKRPVPSMGEVFTLVTQENG